MVLLCVVTCLPSVFVTEGECLPVASSSSFLVNLVNFLIDLS